MASFEKFWNDSSGHYRSNAYSNLVAEREATECICTPEQQAGADADTCMACNRKTMHIFCGVRMNPDCGSNGKKPTKDAPTPST